MPSRSTQLPRAASLIVSSLGFIHDLRTELLQPDTLRGTPLDMDQYRRLFGTARIPTDHGCKMETDSNSKHIVVLRCGQFCTVFCPFPLAIITDDLPSRSNS
jgi:carnitine O-acetyltransferase